MAINNGDKLTEQTNGESTTDKQQEQNTEKLLDNNSSEQNKPTSQNFIECVCGKQAELIENCFGCKKSGCEECLNMVCCDCGVYLCEVCKDNDDIWCGCYGNCTSCGDDVDRGGDGWPCSQCKQWLCEKCRGSKKCMYCGNYYLF